MAGLPPPPTNDATGSFAWLEWFRQLRAYISTTGSVPWSIIDFAGSTLSSIASRSHQVLQSLQGGTTGEYYHLTQSNYNEVTTNLDLSGTSGTGVKVDLTTPTFGWKDLLGRISIRGLAAANDPNPATYRGTLKQFQFAVNDECELEFHIPHDYAIGTDIYLHFHWSQILTTVTGGSVTWGAEVSYAKGHNQAAFIAPITTTVAGNASTTQYQHMITEVQLSAATPSGSQIDSDNLEPDGLLLVRVYLSANNITVSGGPVPEPFLHFADIHYQSTNIATKNKSPTFYV